MNKITRLFLIALTTLFISVIFLSCQTQKEVAKDAKGGLNEKSLKENILKKKISYKYDEIIKNQPFYTEEVLKAAAFNAYYKGDFESAEKFFGDLFNPFNATYDDSNALYAYIDVLKKRGEKDTSGKLMSIFVREFPSDLRALNYEQKTEYLSRLEKAPKLFNVAPVYHEKGNQMKGFATDIVGPKMIISVKKDSTFFVKDNSNRKNYNLYSYPIKPLDLFSVTEDRELKSLKTLNSKNDDDLSFTYSSKSKFILFASSRALKDEGRVSIYISKIEDFNTFSEPVLVSFDDGVSDFLTPHLSYDGKTLYFASNKKDGIGGYDLYKIGIDNKGEFLGEPENLGKNINTESDEVWPYLSNTNVFYYSSNGLLGFGGYDVFYNDLKVDDSASINLGKDINTEKNELSFIFDGDKKVGFFTRNNSSYSSDLLYRVTRIDRFFDVKNCKKVLQANFFDIVNKEPIEGATVKMYNEKGMLLLNKTTDSKGYTDFSVDCMYDDVTLRIKKDGYKEVVVNLNVTDYLENKNFYLGINRVGIEKAKNLPQTILSTDGTEDDLFIKNAYIDFDFNQVVPQQGFENVLDRIYNIISSYSDSNMKLSIISHADTRGTLNYNDQLTERRAETIKEYLVGRGFPSHKIIKIARGKRFPLEPCSECTEKQNSENRRTLFKIN